MTFIDRGVLWYGFLIGARLGLGIYFVARLVLGCIDKRDNAGGPEGQRFRACGKTLQCCHPEPRRLSSG